MNVTLPSVSVVIPTFRRAEALARTLRSLATITYRGSFEIIVVDDGSSDDTSQIVELIREEHPRLRLRYLEQSNSGAATARNLGAREADSDVLVFLDDDMLVQQDHVERHVAHLTDPKARRIVNGAWEFDPEVQRDLESSSFGRFRLSLEAWMKRGIEMDRVDANLSKPVSLTACSLGIRREDFLGLGGFDESFPAAGYEDQEFSVRAARAGFEFIYDRRIELSHLDQRTELRDFSLRVRQGALTAGIMARRYPTEFGSRPLIVENRPASLQDGWVLVLKKLLKYLLATRPGRAVVRTSIWVLEHVAPNSQLMSRAYWAWCGIWIHQGVREGLRTAADG